MAKPLDRFLQRYRFRVARAELDGKPRLLDIGTSNGELFDYLGDRIRPSVGIEPDLDVDVSMGDHMLLAGMFPSRQPTGAFDAATLLAVVEHMDADGLSAAADALSTLVRPGGKVVITMPSPAVDTILDVLISLHLLDGMDTDSHHGLRVDAVPESWSRHGLKLVKRKKFQLGLNNLLVFEVEAKRAHAGAAN